MGFLRQMFGLERDGVSPAAAVPAPGPQAMAAGTMVSVSTPAELEEALRIGSVGASGQVVTESTALKVATVFACIRIRSGAIANTPLGIKRRVDDRTRADATDQAAWTLLNRRPNRWQTPATFKRMMEAHVLLRGEAYAVKSRGVGNRIVALTPLHPDRVRKVQLANNELAFEFMRKDGSRTVLPQDDVFNIVGLTLDGVNGLSVLKYARDAIGLALAQEGHGSSVFRNGANVSAAFKLPAGKTLTDEQTASLKTQLDEYRQGGARDGKSIVLEDGLEYEQMALSAEDAQWLQSREFSRTDLCMFFGVQPHLIGITAGNTQLGSSIEAQSQGFVTYALEDSFTGWEETIGLQLLQWDLHPDLYARFNRNALVRGDITTRWNAYVKGMQWGVMSPNEVRALEDMNPRADGDIYYPPPNTAGNATGDNNVPA